MLYFTEADVQRLLPLRDAVALVRRAFHDLAGGTALNQPRRRLVLPTGAVLHYMAASDGKYFGAKVYSTHARHGAHFVFLLYASEDARPLALFEANYLGQIRTGAASAVATDLMARPDADTLGLIGTGFQARTQAEAMVAVRPVREIRVWSRSEERRHRFVADYAKGFGIPVLAAESGEAALRDASIVVTATNAKDPVLEAGWVAPGTHINAMGSNQANRRELPAELIRTAALIAVDSMEQARMESGDLLLGLEDWGAVVELQDLVTEPPIWNERAITVFKSNGLAVEDVAAAGYVYERGLEEGFGRRLPILEDYS